LFWEEFCKNQPKKLTWDQLTLPLIWLAPLLKNASSHAFLFEHQWCGIFDK
jgi:hypothetical protein